MRLLLDHRVIYCR